LDIPVIARRHPEHLTKIGEFTYRQHREAMTIPKAYDIRTTRHRAISVHQLAWQLAGFNPANIANSTAPSVSPRRFSTPPGLARIGKT
jgi:hypothetical protein